MSEKAFVPANHEGVFYLFARSARAKCPMAPMMIITRQYERGFQFILFPRDDFKLHSEAPIDFLVFSEHVRGIERYLIEKRELSWKSRASATVKTPHFFTS